MVDTHGDGLKSVILVESICLFNLRVVNLQKISSGKEIVKINVTEINEKYFTFL